MPQLDFSVFPSQLFWLSISFFCLLFIMRWFVIPKTAEMINLRKSKIDAELEDAAKIKQKVEKTLEKYNQALKKATDEARISLQKTRDDINATIERKQADLTIELNRQIVESEKKIASIRQKSLSGVDEAVVILVPEIMKKLGFEKVPVSVVKNAINFKGESK